jgi:hypothetical protein
MLISHDAAGDGGDPLFLQKRSIALYALHPLTSSSLEYHILAQKKDDAKSYDHDAPETVDDCLFLLLKPFDEEKISIADFDLHGDKKSYNQRDD